MNTLDCIIKKYNIDPNGKLPIEIPNVGRNDLANLFRELGFTIGAEIGVQEGIYSEMLLLANPEVKLYGVDPWTFYSTARNFRKQRHLDEHYATAVKRLTPYKNYVIVKKSSMDAVKDFEDNSLDFVYIDADHEYLHVVQDIVEWSKKVKKGGIISGDDYITSNNEDTHMHVIYAVDGYVKAHKILPFFLLGRKHKLEGEIRDKIRSWFWVKP